MQTCNIPKYIVVHIFAIAHPYMLNLECALTLIPIPKPVKAYAFPSCPYENPPYFFLDHRSLRENRKEKTLFFFIKGKKVERSILPPLPLLHYPWDPPATPLRLIPFLPTAICSPIKEDFPRHLISKWKEIISLISSPTRKPA